MRLGNQSVWRKMNFGSTGNFLGCKVKIVKANGIKICGLMSIILILAIVGVFAWLTHEGRLNYRSSSDTFQIKILEVKSQPNVFMERIRVQCLKDIDAGIWVSDLKKAGIFEAKGPNGEDIYQEGHPHQAGQSVQVHTDGGFLTCEILFRITTSSTDTTWHSEDAGGTCDTTLRIPLVVTKVQTNWPSSYQRGTDIPLANLGEYKILLSIK
jgi:hypothetical protein